MNENTVRSLVRVGKRLKKLALANKGLISMKVNVFHRVEVHITNEALAEIIKNHSDWTIVDRYPGEDCPEGSYRWQVAIAVDGVEFFTLGNVDDFEKVGMHVPSEISEVGE